MLGSRQHWMGHTNAHKCALFTVNALPLEESGCFMLDASVLSRIVQGEVGKGKRTGNKIKIDTVCIVFQSEKYPAKTHMPDEPRDNGGALLRIGIATRHGHTDTTPGIEDLLIDRGKFGSGPCVRHPYRIKDDMFFEWNNSSTTSSKYMCHCADPYFANQAITYNDAGVPDTDLILYCGTNVDVDEDGTAGGDVYCEITIYYDDVE